MLQGLWANFGAKPWTLFTAGWTNNKLRVKPSSSVSRVEVLGPGALSNAFGTVSRTVGGGGVSGPPHPAAPCPAHPLPCGFSRQCMLSDADGQRGVMVGPVHSDTLQDLTVVHAVLQKRSNQRALPSGR